MERKKEKEVGSTSSTSGRSFYREPGRVSTYSTLGNPIDQVSPPQGVIRFTKSGTRVTWGYVVRESTVKE